MALVDTSLNESSTSAPEKDNSQSLCRVCMTRSMNMKCLFTIEGTQTIKQLEYCTGLLIKKEDGLPTNMCELCLSSLAIAHKFKTMCLRADYIFRNVVKKPDTTGIKIEVDEEIEAKHEYEELVPKKEIDINDDDEIYNGIEIDELSSDEFPNPATRTKIKTHNKKRIKKTTTESKLQRQKNGKRNIKQVKDKNISKNSVISKEKNSKKEQSLSCRLCNITLANQEERKEHIKTVHDNCEWMCEVCGKMFNHRSTLHSHVKSHFPPNEQCPHCEYKTWLRADLHKHIRIHKGIKNYVCEHCTKGFFTSSNLTEHIKRVHGQMARNFVCPRCGRAFYYMDKLRRHLDTHDNIKRFECQECHDRFSRRCQWKNHLEKMHNIIIPRLKPGRRKTNVVIDVKNLQTNGSNLQEHIV